MNEKLEPFAWDKTSLDILASFRKAFGQWAVSESVPQYLRDDLTRFDSWFGPIVNTLSARRVLPGTGMTSPVVRQLEWSPWDAEGDVTFARTPVGRYSVNLTLDEISGEVWTACRHTVEAFTEIGVFASEDEAKAAAQADYKKLILSALVTGKPEHDTTEAGEGWRPTHRHKKRGTEYVLIGFGKMQAERWLDGTGDMRPQGRVDMREVAIYRSVADGELWVRPRGEFEDGRFEPLPVPPTVTERAEG